MLVARPIAHAEECIVSYLIRVAEQNGFKNIGHLLQYAGIGWRNGRVPIHTMLTGDFDLSPHLSHLNLRNYSSPAARICYVFENVVDTPYIFVKSPKICPLCVASNGYCSYLWTFLPIIACNMHKVLLIDTYEYTGKRLSWYRGKVNGLDKINENLNIIPLTPNSQVLQFNEYIEALLTNAVKVPYSPDILTGLSFREVLTIIHFLAHYSARVMGSAFHPYQMNNIDLTKVYVAVWDLLKKWPDAFYSLLSQFIDHPMSTKGKAGLNKHYRDLYQQLHRMQGNRGIALIKKEFDRYVNTYWPGVLTDKRVTRIQLPSSSRNIISKKEAASIIGCRPERIDKLILLERLTRVVFKGQAHYLRDETEAFAASLRSSWSMSQACNALQLTSYQVKQLLDAGILKSVQKPDSMNRDWLIDKDECKTLISQLIHKSRSGKTPKESISMAGVQHQGLSIAKLICAMRDGHLEYSYEPDNEYQLSLKQFVNFVRMLQ